VRLIPHLVLLLSALLGGLSLLGFASFLAVGPFEVIPLGLSPRAALAWDAALCVLFFVQHSSMIRRPFRERLARLVPVHYHAALYSIAAGLALVLLLGLWQHSNIVLASVQGPPRWVVRGVFLATGPVFLWALRALGPFDTFGLEPIRAHLRGAPPRAHPFAIRGPYRWVRHPLYCLFLVMLWASPDVTADRLLFAALFTGWIVLGTVLEERDLVQALGDPYREYQERVPMLLPWRWPSGMEKGRWA
jgi:protein-S-isoprenylcysteine O-methyltransferase Ste14